MGNGSLVVIGAGGMGEAVASRLGSGRRVVLADYNLETLDVVASRLRDFGHDVHTQFVDVGDPESVQELAAFAGDLGRVTSLVHTAGVSPVQAPVEAIVRVDLLGVAYVIKAFESVLSPGGAAVVVSSMAGHIQQPFDQEFSAVLAHATPEELAEHPELQPDTIGDPATAYGIAKRANRIRVQGAALGWGEKGLRINTISPGIIATPMGQAELDGPNGEIMRGMITGAGVRRIGTPDDIAAATEFLLGPNSSFLTGSDILVDGGVVAAMAQ